MKKLPTILATLFATAILMVFAVAASYWHNFSGVLSSQNDVWGQFGDYFGGVLNPILAFLALVALLFTLRLQSDELKETRKELASSTRALEEQVRAARDQSFERLVFDMIRLHADITANIDVRRPNSTDSAHGRDCFEVLYKLFQHTHGEVNSRKGESSPHSVIVGAYSEFLEGYQQEVGHYFRMLHRILKYIDESHISDKATYTGIVRAQLSSYELVFLFYNCLHPVGEKLKPLVERYAMLENLSPELLCNPADELPLYETAGFGDLHLGRYSKAV